MSELQSMRAILDRAGVVYSVMHEDPDADIVLEIEAGLGPANRGYPHFVSRIGFSEEGALLWVGAWE
jgi:hypothetical protein